MEMSSSAKTISVSRGARGLDCQKFRESERRGVVATSPHRIMSSRVVDEARAVPPQIIKTKLDKLIQKARDLGKEEIIEELKTRWEAFHSNVNSGIAAAELGASITIARHELFPQACQRTRLFPNRMMESSNTLLFCPQCKGDFVSSGIINRTGPITTDPTKSQIEEMEAKDQELGDIAIVEEEETRPKEEATKQDDPSGQPSADYSPGEMLRWKMQ